LFPLRTEAEGECKSDGLETEGVDMIGEEEWCYPHLIRVTPGPFLKNTAPNTNREGARNKNVLGCIGMGVWAKSRAAWTRMGGGCRGSGTGAKGEAPNVKLVHPLPGAIREGGGVCVGKNGGNL